MNFTLVRGESFPVEFEIKDEGNNNLLADEVIITCRKLPFEDSPILFQKKLSDNTITYLDNKYKFVILEDDTKDLDYGTYGYDIKIIKDELIEKFVGSISINEEYNNEYSSND